MKRILQPLLTLIALVGFAGLADAELITIGTATHYGDEYKLIWDADNNGNSVVWLDYTNVVYTEVLGELYPSMDWTFAKNSVSNYPIREETGLLTYNIDPAYDVSWGSNVWRMPDTDQTFTEAIFDQFGNLVSFSASYNVTSSELGHLFYEELGNLGRYDPITGDPFANLDDYGLKNTGDFDNLMAHRYWSATEVTALDLDVFSAYTFDMSNGKQSWASIQDQSPYPTIGALYLRTASVTVQDETPAPVPEPSTILLMVSGLIGLAGFRKKFKKS